MIEVENLTKKFNEVTALNGVSFRVNVHDTKSHARKMKIGRHRQPGSSFSWQIQNISRRGFMFDVSKQMT